MRVRYNVIFPIVNTSANQNNPSFETGYYYRLTISSPIYVQFIMILFRRNPICELSIYMIKIKFLIFLKILILLNMITHNYMSSNYGKTEIW